MPSLEQIRETRIKALAAWGREHRVLSKPLPYDRLLNHATRLWPCRHNKTLKSYAKTALILMRRQPE